MSSHRFQIVVLVGGVLLAAVIPASANLVSNGSFEAPVSSSYSSGFPGSGSQYNYITVNCGSTVGSSPGVCGPVTLNGWTYTDTAATPPGNSGGAGLAANGSAFGNTRAPDGNQALLLQNQASASQTINGVISGDTYTFSFYVEQRASGVGQTLDVTFGNQTLFAGAAPSNSSYTLESGSIVANQSGSLALVFAGLTPAPADATVFVDDVTLNGPQAPEPAFYSLLALGLGGLAMIVSRRNRAKA